VSTITPPERLGRDGKQSSHSPKRAAKYEACRLFSRLTLSSTEPRQKRSHQTAPTWPDATRGLKGSGPPCPTVGRLARCQSHCHQLRLLEIWAGMPQWPDAILGFDQQR